MNLNYTTEQITFQEVPNEISLSFLIAGCPLKCKGCHSADSWRVTSEAHKASEAEIVIKEDVITTNKSKIYPINSNAKNQLTKEINEVNRQYNIGWTYIFENNLLDYLKTGRWIRELGGLDNKNTNQRFYKVNYVKYKEVGIFSQNNNDLSLFHIGVNNNNCFHNSTQCQLNYLDVKQVLSNILMDKTWMFQ